MDGWFVDYGLNESLHSSPTVKKAVPIRISIFTSFHRVLQSETKEAEVEER